MSRHRALRPLVPTADQLELARFELVRAEVYPGSEAVGGARPALGPGHARAFVLGPVGEIVVGELGHGVDGERAALQRRERQRLDDVGARDAERAGRNDLVERALAVAEHRVGVNVEEDGDADR